MEPLLTDAARAELGRSLDARAEALHPEDDLMPASLAESHPLLPSHVDFSDPQATIPLGPAAVLPMTRGTTGRGWTYLAPPGPGGPADR